MTLMPQFPDFWDYKCVPPHPALKSVLFALEHPPETLESLQISSPSLRGRVCLEWLGTPVLEGSALQKAPQALAGMLCRDTGK